MSVPEPNFSEPLQGSPSQAQLDQIKRRWQSRSEEEIAEHMDRGNLPYRKGWPQLPPLPVDTISEGARAEVNNPQDVIEAVDAICKSHGIINSYISFAFRVPKVRQPGERYHTLVVATYLWDDFDLVSIIIQIRKYLQQDPKHEEISIEIIDDRVVYGLFSFAIPPSETHLLNIWEPVFDIVLEEIRKAKEQWITIEMLYRGLERDAADCRETVVITSPSAAEDIWIKAILPNIHKRVQKESSSLAIELLCGSSIKISSSTDESLFSSKQYQYRVPMGSSIGQEGVEGHSGTAGGMVKLSDGKTYALTSDHVVGNADLDDRLKNKSSDPTKRLPLTSKNPAFNPTNHRFVCPSDDDNISFIEYHENALQIWLSRTKDDISQGQLDSSRAELEMAKMTERTLGKFHASASGLRLVEYQKLSSDPANGNLAAETGKSQYQFMLDWALIEMRSSRVMTNYLPDMQQKTFGILIPALQCSQWTALNNPKCNVSRDKVSVGKFGRTTGFTNGTINSIPTIINPEIEGGRYKFVSETQGFTVKDCGYSWSFVGHRGDVAVGKGDSGSIVLHEPSGDWLGLLFGETSTDAALFTPIDLVLRDIEKVTGQKILEPTYNSGL